MHSKWASGNPMFDVECSSIRLSGSQGLWFSQKCIEKEKVICGKSVNAETVFILPGLLQTTTEPSEGTTVTTPKKALSTDPGAGMDQITTQAIGPYGGLLQYMNMIIIFIPIFQIF